MPKVTFLPMNTTVEAADGDSILDTALDNDIPIQHACGGFCACTTCRVQVKEGIENLYPMEDEEEDRLAKEADITDQTRLGCQSKVKGDITVEVLNLE